MTEYGWAGRSARMCGATKLGPARKPLCRCRSCGAGVRPCIPFRKAAECCRCQCACAQVVEAVSKFEFVTVGANEEQVRLHVCGMGCCRCRSCLSSLAHPSMQAAQVDNARSMMPKSKRVTVVDLPQDDSWFRDTGPLVSLETPARESCCISPAILKLGGIAKRQTWSQSCESWLSIAQFVVRRDEAGRNVAIRGNDFVFNSWGRKNVKWDVDDEIADWVRCEQSRLSVLGCLCCKCEGPHLYACCQCCRSCIMRALSGTGRSLCSRAGQSMSTAKGASACIARWTGTSHALDEWVMCRQHLRADCLYVHSRCAA